jgi:hypothetical protein
MSQATCDEVSLEDLLGDDGDGSDRAHLACGCSPQLEFCGRYVPWSRGVELVVADDDVCKHCQQVWDNGGCPRCPCGPEAICQACYTSAAQG